MNQDQPNPKRSLSEISHLFLSSVRERQTGGAAKPVRKPPTAKPDVSIDLTPEEFAQVVGQGAAESISAEPGPVTAILSAHLTEGSFDRAREYAAHLAADGSRIGLIECDSSIFRLMFFERSLDPASTEQQEPVSAEGFDVRRMRESLEELSWDVDRWLLLLPSPRTHEARALLRNIGHWVLLSTCDHDGVVSCYRTLKGLTDLNRPRISLALLDASDEVEAEHVFNKLSSVSQQFLSCPLEAEPSVRKATNVTEYLALCCRATRDKTPMANPPQWQLVSDFLARSKPAAPVQKETTVPHIQPAQEREPLPKQMVADIVIPDTTSAPAPAVAQPLHNEVSTTNEVSDVLDLPDGASTPAAIIGAVMHDGSNQLIECPVKPPMCPDASLAVSRDHRLTIVAVAKQGLSDLRLIGQAYQWLIQNRSLVAMAMPQFAIDAHQLPQLQLLVDQADASAEILQTMLQSSNVTVVAYRKLRWAGRTGLLLKAA